jgi:hypothetical protein
MKIHASLLATLALIACAAPAPLRAAEPAPGTLLFSDDFEREDGSKQKDGIGNGWGTNSNSRAAGNKQVELKNGAMYISMHPAADHAVSVTHPAEFKDGVVSLRFMLEGEKDSLGVDFADLQCKEVHAGHLFKVTASTKKVDVDDMKTGGMNLKFNERKKSKTLTPDEKEFIASKKKSFPLQLDTGKWHDLRIHVAGDTISVSVNGKNVGSFTSEGFAHPTKRMIRLSVPHSAVVDDVKAFSFSVQS